MANVVAAINYVLKWEDSTLSGQITSTPDGKRTRFGIDEHFHPELTACLFYTSLGRDAALRIAEGIYEKSYAEPLCVEQMANQDIANKMLSLGVNIGCGTAARLLQEALGVNGDGRIGPLTLDALERHDPNIVLDALRHEAEDYYNDLIAKHPGYAVYRAGWLRRAEA